MATIAQDRIRHYQYNGMGGMPPTLEFQIKASEAAAPAGQFWKIASGLVLAAATGNPLIVGFNDKKTLAASATQALCPMVPLTMILPNVLYEASFESGAAAITVLGVPTRHVANATFGATIGTATATNVFVPVAFFGAAVGSNFQYTTGAFTGKTGTLADATALGTINSGGINDKGTVGDTTPRLITLISIAATIVV